jgi:hypothetical protein
MSVEWRPVVGYEECYAVSDEGFVVRTATYGRCPKPRWKPCKPRMKKGYAIFHLCKDGDDKDIPGHQITWKAFFGEIPEGLQINHINSKRSENGLGNLELMTGSENVAYSFSHNGRPAPNNPSPGSKHGLAKMTETDIPKIMTMHRSGMFLTHIAKLFSVTPEAIGAIVRGKTWRHVSRHAE